MTIALRCVALAVALAVTPAAVRAEDLQSLLNSVDCGEALQTNLPYQFDYRQRASTVPSPIGTSAQWNYQDNWSNHTGPAMRRVQAGEYSRNVIADLHFTFLRWPNHLQALLALTKYYNGGGKQHEYLPAECYLRSAAQFAPDDADVMVVTGVYFFQRRNWQAAREALDGALKLNPNSLEAHYNLGLVYLQIKDNVKAKEHAVLAYEGGYPLPGLKKKLEQAGAW